MSSHDSPSTSGKKIANSTVGKIIAAQLLALLLAAPAAATGPCDARAVLKPRTPRSAFALGDSVMLGAAPALARAGFRVNARGCRQIGAGLAVLARRRRLPRTVVVALGANGTLERRHLARLLRIVGPRRRLVLVTPRGPDHDARLMRRAARRRPGRVCLADWARRARTHRAWTGPDGLHLTASGVRAYTRLLTAHRRGACAG